MEFVRQVTDLANTETWSCGTQIQGATQGVIARGTAIATFDDKGHYPTDSAGRHAAIYLSHDDTHIKVLDQWNAQGQVLTRSIRFQNGKTSAGKKYSRSNDGSTFYVIE